MDWPLIEQKLEALRRALQRIKEKCPEDVEALINDYDAQDILALNLTRAIQLCVDIGAHLISSTEFPPPNTMGETFDVLNKAAIIPPELAIRMKKAVGFRNLAVHNYEAINWTIVHVTAKHHLTDFEAFARSVVKMQEQGTG